MKHALATNKTDIPVEMVLKLGSATDDLGYLTQIYYSDVRFSDNQDRTSLIPDTPTRFTITIHDPHPAVKTINVQFKVRWKGDYIDLVYPKVPVQ